MMKHAQEHREWEFVRYPSLTQTIRGVIQEDEKGVHHSGAEMLIFRGIKGFGFRFTYRFEGRELLLEARKCTEDWEVLDGEAPESQFQIGPCCSIIPYFRNNEHRQKTIPQIVRETIENFKGAPFEIFVGHLCSFLREFHHSAELFLLPPIEPLDKTIKPKPITKDNKWYQKRTIKINKFEFGRSMIEDFKPQQTQFILRGEEA